MGRWGYENRFDSWALKIMDWFMLNEHPYLYETGTTPLEKLSHQYHMHEIYIKASNIYKEFIKNPPKDEIFCTCVNDVTANGILMEVVNIAGQLKYRGNRPRQGRAKEKRKYVIDGEKIKEKYPRGRGRVIMAEAPVTLARFKRSTEQDEEIRILQEKFLNNSNEANADKLLDVAPWIPGNFTGEADQWISYSAMLIASLPSQEGIRDFAAFMYCKLNHPDEDHPKNLF